MRILVIAAVAVLGMATAAQAAEGNGDPFPGVDAGVTTVVAPGAMVARSQDPYQFRIVGAPVDMQGYRAAPSATQDPFPFRVAGRVVTMPQPATAIASTASPASVAQRIVAPGTHG